MKLSQKNVENWRFWKMTYFWVGHFEFFFASFHWKMQPISMRDHFFLHYGWFFQNLRKEAVRTFMHTTVSLLVHVVIEWPLILFVIHKTPYLPSEFYGLVFCLCLEQLRILRRKKAKNRHKNEWTPSVVVVGVSWHWLVITGSAHWVLLKRAGSLLAASKPASGWKKEQL